MSRSDVAVGTSIARSRFLEFEEVIEGEMGKQSNGQEKQNLFNLRIVARSQVDVRRGPTDDKWGPQTLPF